MKRILYAFITVLLIGCLYLGVRFALYKKHQGEFDSKPYWAILNQDQGMVSYQIYLYKDSTYYTDILDQGYWGKYYIKGNTLYLFSDEGIICDKYILERDDMDIIKMANASCTNDKLYFNFEEGRGRGD
jgi:cbb3-type cytochrome oxidase subunit 3